MRKRSLSVAYERPTKVEQISKKFEGVPSEPDTESEEENEELDAVETASDWTLADYKKLVEQLRSVLPRKDNRKHSSVLKKIDWDRVAFDEHTSEEVKAVANDLINKIRKHRTLSEIVEDIPQQLEKIFSSGKPKNPLSAYNLFVKEKFSSYKTKNPGLSASELFKLVSQAFAGLSEKKKQKYEAMAAQAKEAHKQQLEQYYKDNPQALQSKKIGKTPKEKQRKIKIPKTITPFALFKLDKKTENSHITTAELRGEWNELELKKKLKYIQQAFKTKTESTSNSLKLTKEEQRLLEQAKGKPGTFPKSTSEYYLKHYAENDPSMSLSLWRKEKLLEYKRMSKLRKLELEIEYRQAKQEYVNKYEAYIEQIEDDKAREAEINLLRSFIQTKMDKHDREQCDSRPLRSMIDSSRLDNEMMDFPIAESTILTPKTKKAKAKVGEKPIKPEPVAVETPQKKPVKSILKSPAPVTVVPKSMVQEFIAPGTVSSPKKKRKQSLSGQDSDSSSTEKRHKHSIITNASKSEETGTKKASSKENGTTQPLLPNEPIRPPTNTLQFYKQNYYLGKAEKCEESFKQLSAARKESIKTEMRAAHKKYFKQLQKFLKSVPQKNIELYLKKLKQAERDSNKSGELSSSDDDESGNVSVAKGTKQEPETSSSSSSDDENTAAPAKPQNGEDDDEEEDVSSSDE